MTRESFKHDTIIHTLLQEQPDEDCPFDDAPRLSPWSQKEKLPPSNQLPDRTVPNQERKGKLLAQKDMERENEDQLSTLSPLPEGTLPRRWIAQELEYVLVDADELAEIEAVLYAEDGIPDNVEEARTECVYEFLEQYLLPKMRVQADLTERELLVSALEHKRMFKGKHPSDFWDGHGYQFLPSVGFALTQLEIYYGIGGQWEEPQDEIPNMVWKAAQAFRRLDLDVLYGMG